MTKRKVEVCFTPATYKEFENTDAVVVVVDILRATTSIVTAFMNGVKQLIPVGTLDEAKAYKSKGYMVAAERDGIVRDFADFGNSPDNFTPERVKDNEIVYSTTNGTNSIMMAKDSHRVVIGSYLNHKALVEYIIKENRDLLILCAAWKNKFNLEDSIFAGALAKAVLGHESYITQCDSTLGAIDLWNVAEEQGLQKYVLKTAQKGRLAANGLDGCIDYCHTFDTTRIIPVLQEKYLVSMEVFETINS